MLTLLFLATFTLGYGEELVVGVLDLIAADLRVPIPAAGGLVTAYAVGLAIGGPVLTALTIRRNRKSILLVTLVVFLVATLLPLLIENLVLFFLTRATAGAAGGLFIAAALITATAIIPADRTGRALSAVISGFMVATGFGVPLGTLVGQALGWRGAFAPRVLAMLGLMILVFTAISSAFTYIVPFLRDVTGVSGPAVSVFLLAYGAATAVGSSAGGRFADRAAARTVTSATVGLAAGLVALYLVGASAPLVAVALLIWGAFAFGMVPALQYRIVELAGPGGDLAASLPASAANAGIALGAVAGGAALATFGTPAAVLTAVMIAVLAIPAALATSRLRPPDPPSTATSAEPASTKP